MLQSPTVTHYIGELGFKSVCQRSIEYADDEILFLTDILEWYKVYTAEYDNNYYIPKRLEKNIALKMLTVRNARAERMKERDFMFI